MTRPLPRDVTSVSRGERLWRDMNSDDLAPGQRVLLEEACRIADRLDKLDRLLAGSAKDWISLVADRGDLERQIVVIDRPLSEACQQATALKQLIAEIRAATGAKPGEQPKEGDSDELAKRREERRRAAGL